VTTDDDFEPVIEDLLVIEGGSGDDSTPLIALVREAGYSRGTLTSSSRTTSEQYLRFLGRKSDESRG
jgi:hypothetical protein